MNPYIHAKNSAVKFGGIPEDYLEIHQFMDSAKEHIPTLVHRLILHNTFGIALACKLFGDFVQTGTGKIVRQPFITNSEGKKVYVRDIAQQHVFEDLTKIPSLSEQFSDITIEMVATKLGVFVSIIRKIERTIKNV